jgi:hypothetical protein
LSKPDFPPAIELVRRAGHWQELRNFLGALKDSPLSALVRPVRLRRIRRIRRTTYILYKSLKRIVIKGRELEGMISGRHLGNRALEMPRINPYEWAPAFSYQIRAVAEVSWLWRINSSINARASVSFICWGGCFIQ